MKSDRKRETDREYDRRRRQEMRDARGLTPRQANAYYVKGWELREDGIFDHIAVDIAVSGERRVRLTKRERHAAIKKCGEAGMTIEQIAALLYVAKEKVRKVLYSA